MNKKTAGLKQRVRRFSVALVVMVLGLLGALGLASGADRFHTKVSLLTAKQTVALGESVEVGVLLKMAPGWHTYWKDPGEAGMATSIDWKLPDGFKAGPIRWPKPKVFSTAGIASYGYAEEVLLLIEIQVPSKGYPDGKAVTLEAQVQWLECENLCVPGTATVSTGLRIGKIAGNVSGEVTALFEKYRALIPPDDYDPSGGNAPPPRSISGGPGVVGAPPPSPAVKSLTPTAVVQAPLTLMEALFAAFIGGLILNLMPCVLPVIAIKILGFVAESRAEPKRTRELGLMFGLGVLVSLWILAFIVIGVKAAGSQVGWGFQFQEPRFVMAMAVVVTVIALNFFGVFEFEISAGALQTAATLAARTGRAGAFFNGVLATTLATPCTAPFLAPALGFAFSQPPGTVIAMFSAVALGLALPYVLLAWEPRLLRWLPKPGAWMLRFKQAMGFPMIATAIWLTSILGGSFFTAATWLVVIAFVIWMTCSLGSGRFLWVALALAVTLTAAYQHIFSIKPVIEWRPFSKASLQSALQTSQPVFIDFTADWCLTCQVNRKTAIEVESVARRFKELNVIPLLADWTKPNHEITEALRSFDRSGVPLCVFYPVDRNQPPIVLPEGILTPQIVLDALNRAAAHK